MANSKAKSKLGLVVCLALIFGCVSRGPETTPPKQGHYEIYAEQTWRMNLPQGQRFDASGLFLDPSGTLLTESDQEIGIYKIHFTPGSNSVDLLRIPDCFTPEQLTQFAWEKWGRFDCEGVTEDDEGRIYLCEEGNRWVLRWDPKTKTVQHLDIDWSPVAKYFSDDHNAAWEGIAIHGHTMYLANERKKGRILVIDLDTLRIVDDFVTPACHSLWYWDTHYSDLCWFEGSLYALLREDHVILKINPNSHAILAEYDFRKMEESSENNYYKVVPFGVGVMEGLAVDKKYFWLCTDNNGLGRKKYPNDTRPSLFKCPRPDVF